MRVDRKTAIIDLINQNEISTQEELTSKLIEMGYKVSQATVSRDIKQLNLVKANGAKRKVKYIQAHIGNTDISQKLLELFKHITLSIEIANNLVVVKTLSGNGGSAGMAIDQMRIPQIVGSVAGDDTVLIIAKTNSDAEIIIKSLRLIING